ncbi:MAG: acyl-CoA dehydrogenase family protein [Actinomycetota bacterium]|nr:acyl-CoA dehydrogenase family protein [Actinomycetota bacterium]
MSPDLSTSPAAARVAPHLDAVDAAIAESESSARMPAPLARRLADAGLLTLGLPRRHGGPEAPCAELCETIELVSRTHASAGWCVMIASTTSTLAAYLDPEHAATVFADPATIVGGVTAPSGTATIDGDTVRVEGRWSWGSGSENCAWFALGCLVTENGHTVTNAAGQPSVRLVLLPADDVRIAPNWDVSGLRGTGSHDLVVDGAVAPAGRAVELGIDRPRIDGALYRFPIFGLLALGVASVSLGIARAAIDDLVSLAGAKTPTGHRRLPRDRAMTQVDVARAEASLRAARAYFYESIAAAWDVATTGAPLSLEHRTSLRLAATHAATIATEVVGAMYTAGGGSAIRADNPLQRHLRDVHVPTQHIMVAPATWEVAGRALVGLDPANPAW